MKNLFNNKSVSLFYTIFFLLFFTSNSNSQCHNLPVTFHSYKEAIETVQNTVFKFVDELPEEKSSWIVTAHYYSCDNKFGYLIYITKNGSEYIHKGVPKNVWLDFKNAPSSGSYYDYHIKHKYRLALH